ncbi:MAG: B12-binding domain-containing radical SAM protein [Elusimicrobia bacterium]|nr:B12-binding domain-containing radical SAM protein [Elusimicrobiota bacterium]
MEPISETPSGTRSIFDPRSKAASVHISLIHPPTLTSADAYGLDVVPPLGLAYVAGALKSVGYQVSLVDGIGEALHRYGRASGYDDLLIHGLSPSEVIDRIDPRADIIGLSNMFSNQWLFIQDLAMAIKKAYPDKLLVLGGEHPTACADYIIQSCPDIDVCVLGEGEETILDLADAYRQGKGFHNVAGIVFRNDQKAVMTPKRARIREIDEIPEPDWSLVPVETYIDNACTYGVNVGRAMPILASRGCPYQCTFCSSPQMWTTRWSARKPDLLLAEMRRYIERYNVTNFDFYDLTAIVKKQWIIDFSQLLIKEKLNIRYQLASGTRSEAIDEDVIGLLRESGCRLVIYAPESGSVEELRRIKKKVNIDKMLSSMRAAHDAGMETKANMIFGMLGATWKDVFHSFMFIFRTAAAGLDNMTCYPFSPYPGSENFQTLLATGRIKMNNDYFKSLQNLCRNLHTKNTVSYNDRFSGKVLSLICSCAFIIFYSLNYLIRPWRIAALLYTYLIKKEASSLLTVAFLNMRKKRAAIKTIKTNHIDSVIIPVNLRVHNTDAKHA